MCSSNLKNNKLIDYIPWETSLLLGVASRLAPLRLWARLVIGDMLAPSAPDVLIPGCDNLFTDSRLRRRWILG